MLTTIDDDASVVVPKDVPEVHSAQAEQKRNGHPQRMFSLLVLTEVISAFRRKFHDNVLSRADAQAA
jgi:predicted nucleic acid-binding protein